MALGMYDSKIRFWDLNNTQSQILTMKIMETMCFGSIVYLDWHPTKEYCLAFGTSKGNVRKCIKSKYFVVRFGVGIILHKHCNIHTQVEILQFLVFFIIKSSIQFFNLITCLIGCRMVYTDCLLFSNRKYNIKILVS